MPPATTPATCRELVRQVAVVAVAAQSEATKRQVDF